MENLARKVIQDSLGYEILNGKLVNMSPASSGHTAVVGNIYHIFHTYLHGKPCRPYVDGLMVHFSGQDKVVPDVMVVCNRSLIQRDGVHGSPDLIVEVLSPSTAFNDKGYKKELYERYGVREYWVVDPYKRAVEVYTLQEDRLRLYGVYINSPIELEDLPPELRSAAPVEFSCPLFPELTVKLEDVFYDMM